MNEAKNVVWVVERDLCIGCGLCQAICPRKAVKMKYKDDCGMSVPVLDKKICNNCRVCLEVCYGFKVNSKLNFKISNRPPASIIGDYIKSYTGFAKNQALRIKSASGGVVTALLIHALEENLIDGAIITRMEAGNPPKAKAFIATTIKEIVSGTGSKYCPVNLADCIELIKKNKRYAIVGLPCHIYGIKKLAEYRPDIRDSFSLFFGLLCGGMPSYLGTQYLFRIYDIEKYNIKEIEYRGGGWPGRLFIQGESLNHQKEVSVSYPEYWQGTYRYFFLYRCTVCHDAFNEFSDISYGDAWIPGLKKQDMKGTSLLISRTETGEHLIQDALKKGRIQLSVIKKQEILKFQQGLIRFKNSTLQPRIALSKLLNKKLPIFDLSRIPVADFTGYLRAIILSLGRTVALKKSLWGLLEIHTSLRRSTIGRTRGKLKSNKKIAQNQIPDMRFDERPTINPDDEIELATGWKEKCQK